MTKSELIKRLSDQFPHVLPHHITRMVEIIFSQMTKALVNGNRIELRGFGSFSVREREAREARNPKTNKMVKIDKRSNVYFRSGKELRDRLNQAVTKQTMAA